MWLCNSLILFMQCDAAGTLMTQFSKKLSSLLASVDSKYETWLCIGAVIW